MQFEYSVGDYSAWGTERVSRFDFREVLAVDMVLEGMWNEFSRQRMLLTDQRTKGELVE